MPTCASCGGELAPDHRFCPSCGTPVDGATPEREARKVISALFCDVVGSTALGERLDPEDFTTVVGEAVGLMARTVEELGGTVVELAGDGLLALFGAPVAHEDDAERAVRAGLRIVERIREYAAGVSERWEIEGFTVRVGIETGLAVLGPLGAGRKVEYSAMGDVLNTAARLQAAADRGAVLVGEHTQRAVAGAFEWGPPRELELKGKAARVRAFPVIGVRGEGEPWQPTDVVAPLVGRGAELAAGEQALAAVAAGTGGVLFVTGEAGIGKSRLLFELAARFRELAEGRGLWLHARCASYGEGIPYHPVRGLLLDWLREGGDGDPAQRLRSAGREVLGEAGRGAEPFLAALLEETPDEVPALAPEGVQERTFDAVAALLAGLAERGPVVVAFDDLQWADPTTLDLLDALLELTDDVALLLVLGARPERDHGSWRLRERALRDLPHRVHDVQLEVLADDADRGLLEALVGGEALPAELERRILGRAEGNPFYLEEIVRSLVDTEALSRSAEGWRLDPDAQVEVPETVEKLVLSRIDRLDSDAHAVLSAAAVLGRTFELDLLDRLLDGVEVRGALRELQRLELVRQGRRWPAPEYRFRHSLIQETAYGALLRRHRQELHRRAAAAIADLHGERADEQAGVMARHHHEAGDLEEAFALHRRAATSALRIFAQEEALEHLDGALTAAAGLGRGPEESEVRGLYHERGAVRYDALGDFEGARRDWETAVGAARAAGDRALEVDGLISLASALRVADWPAALGSMDEALEAARASDDRSLLVVALARQSITHANLLWLDSALDLGREALEVAGETGDPWDRTTALDALKLTALLMGDLPRLDALCSELLGSIPAAPGDSGGRSHFGAVVYRAWALQEASYVPAGAGRWEEAEAQVEEALEVAGRGGFITHVTVFLEALARHRRARGDLAGALEAAEDACERAQRTGNHEWGAWAQATAGWTLLDDGRPDEAIARLEHGVTQARRAAAPMPEVRSLGLLADARSSRGDRDGARTVAAATEELLERASFPPGGAFLFGAHAIAGAARARAASGEPERAAALAEPALVAAARSEWAEAEADLALALAAAREAGDDGAAARDLRSRALAVAERAGLPALVRRAAAG